MAGFESKIRGRPSSTQQGLIITRLENLLFRMLVPQVSDIIFKTKTATESIEEKFEEAQKLYRTFFNEKTPYRGTTKEWMIGCYDQLADLLPAFFKDLCGLAPQRRLVELLLHANVSLPFSEVELLMFLVSLNFFLR